MALTAQQQTDLYKLGVGMFNASPGTVYMDWMAGLLNSGTTVTQLYQILATDPSFQAINFGFTDASTNTQFATAFIDQLCGTTLTAANRDFAINFVKTQLDAGVNRGVAMKTAIDALDAVAHDNPNFGAAATMFDNKVAVARDYTEHLNGHALTVPELQGTIASVDQTDASVAAAEAANAAIVNPPPTFTFTTGVDSLTGSSLADVFKAVVNNGGATDLSTYQTGDFANGGPGADTLELTIADGGGGDPLVELNGIETVKVRDLWGASTDASLWTGVTRVESAKSLEDTDIYGLQNGVISATTDSKNNDFDISYDDDVLGTDSYEQFFEFTNAGDSNNTIDNHVDAGGNDQITMVNIKATGKNFVEVGGGGGWGDIEKVTVTGTGAIEVSNHGSSFADATIVNLSANSGGVTIEVGHEDVVVTGGSGADVVTLSNGTTLTSKASISLGAGKDMLINGGSAGVGTAVLDGGDGDDAITSTLLEVGNQANIKNWEILDLAGENRVIDASLFTKSTFKSLALTDVTAGNVTVSKLAGTSIVLDDTASANNASTIQATLATATGTSDSGTINFSGDADSTLAAFRTAGLETFTITSNGDDNTVDNALTLLRTDDNVLTKVTITGANNLTLGNVTTNASATSASADVASTLTQIDGSTATGDLTITAGANAAIGATGFNTTYTSLTIKTGSGDDTVSIGNRGTVSTGTGADHVNVAVLGVSVDVGTDSDADTVVLGAGADYTGATSPTTRMTTISHLGAQDTINFSAIEAAETVITDYTATALTFGSLEAAVDDALANSATQVSLINWVDGNTYLVVDGTDNTIIKLIGDVSVGDLSLAAGIVTHA